MRFLPAYRLRSWRRIDSGGPVLRYRPSLVTVAHRLIVTLVCLVVAAGVEWSFQRAGFVPMSTHLARGSFVEIISSTCRSLAAGRFTGVGNLIELGRFSVTGMLLLVGLMAPLSCLWNRLSLYVTQENDVVLKSVFLWPRRVRYPLNSFSSIRTFAIERYQFGEYGRLEGHYWEWIVQLSIQGQPRLPFPGSAGLAFTSVGPQFHVYRERFQPSMLGRAPEPVRVLVKGLREVTGLPAEPPQLVEGRITGRGRVAYNAAIQENAAEPVARFEGRVGAGEPLPDAIKARLAGMRGATASTDASGVERVVSQRIEVTGADGQKQVYNSIDELPDDIRQRLGL